MTWNLRFVAGRRKWRVGDCARYVRIESESGGAVTNIPKE